MKNILTLGNTKTLKGQAIGYQTYILHLAPSNVSGFQTCPKASEGCKQACLNTAGRGRFSSIQSARIAKTKLFFENRPLFMSMLHTSIEKAIRKADREGYIPVFRLNGTSDIKWEKISYTHEGLNYVNIMQAFSGQQFYDYTKQSNRRDLPANYSLTFSRSEDNELDTRLAMKQGLNVAVVFSKNYMPATYLGRPTFSGEDNDLRFLDPKNVVVALVAKGQAKKDCSGFVVR